MHTSHLSMPQLGLIAGTHFALGVGVGLLLTDRLSHDQRRAVGWTLVGGGDVSTIPLAVKVIGKSG